MEGEQFQKREDWQNLVFSEYPWQYNRVGQICWRQIQYGSGAISNVERLTKSFLSLNTSDNRGKQIEWRKMKKNQFCVRDIIPGPISTMINPHLLMILMMGASNSPIEMMIEMLLMLMTRRMWVKYSSCCFARPGWWRWWCCWWWWRSWWLWWRGWCEWNICDQWQPIK